MKPKVSIIIPIYNVEKYLDRCVQSVRNQTLKDIEIILVDDGSPDNCPAMCDEYAKLDTRIKVIHKENAGLGYARNSGLEIASGEYVAFVDSDDFIEKNMYDCLYQIAIANDADVIFSNVKFNKNGQTIVRKDVNEQRIFKGKKAVMDFLLDMVAPNPQEHKDVKYMASVWRALYKNSIIKKHAIHFCSEREIVSEDLPFNIEFLKHSENAIYSDKAFYNYCYNTESLSKTSSFKKYDKIPKLLEKIKSQLDEIYPPNVYYLHYYRYVLFVLRISLMGDLRICKEQNLDWHKQFNIRCNNKVYKEALTSYPINKMPLKFRLFYESIRNGFSYIIKAILIFSDSK